MKKFLFAMIAILGIGASCSSHYEEWVFSVRDKSGSYVVSASGQTNTVILTTTTDVDITCSESWVHLGTTGYVVQENGKLYEFYPEITFDANNSGAERSAIVYFDNGGEQKLSLRYVQESNPCE